MSSGPGHCGAGAGWTLAKRSGYEAAVLTVVLFATLALFALVVSQPLFYWVALGAASDALPGPAYAALRQAINPVMNRRLLPLYGAALLSAVALCGLAAAHGQSALAAGTAGAIAGLVIDAVLAVRRNVPINMLMDAWDPASPPADWTEHRRRWRAAFATRQLVLAAAFASLLAGTLASR